MIMIIPTKVDGKTAFTLTIENNPIITTTNLNRVLREVRKVHKRYLFRKKWV